VPKKFAFKDEVFWPNTLEFKATGLTMGVHAPSLSAPHGARKPKLLEQVRDAIRVRHYSIRTEQAYIDWRVKLLATR